MSGAYAEWVAEGDDLTLRLSGDPHEIRNLGHWIAVHAFTGGILGHDHLEIQIKPERKGE